VGPQSANRRSRRKSRYADPGLAPIDLEEDALSEALRALSHPDRRRFISACLREPRTAGDLAALSSLAPASVSEHLKVLRKSELLVLEIRGRFWLYRSNPELLRAVIARLGTLLEAGDSRRR
jgi:DNA-binding transcriptional ArsR family regulator